MEASATEGGPVGFIIALVVVAAGVYFVGVKKGWWGSLGWPKGPDDGAAA